MAAGTATPAIVPKEFGVKKSIGIEIDKTIADNARRNIADIKNAYIINKDIRKADISDATVLLFWFSDSDLVDALTRRFRERAEGWCRVITIWAPLA